MIVSKMKRLAVLGSTGSIGRQTLEVARALPHHFQITALAAGGNLKLFNEQVEEFRPQFVYVHDDASMKARIDTPQPLSMEDIARHPDVDLVVVATSGGVGLGPTLAAVEDGKAVALANKEALVIAGEIITALAEHSGARILPVDSEHSAIWQCLEGEARPTRLILTASGGPFLALSPTELIRVTPEQALKHPRWEMGPKITIDSATLMNKGLEVIEARWLFDMPLNRIDILIHPQSIVHSLVEFADGSVKAQLGCPDMRLPIQYALSYPERIKNPVLPRLEWEDMANLTFLPPHHGAFPCLDLALEAGEKGGTYPAVLCAADEVAVGAFLKGRIPFTDIPRLVEEALTRHSSISHPTPEDLVAVGDWARKILSPFCGGG